jgi:hypothetical protein
MGLLHKKSRWERAIEPVAVAATRAMRTGVVRSGLVAAGAAVGMSVASAVVSSMRRQRDKK